ncbi:hypothetical protein CBER1_09826 [Cercospora berteroae]|uniref:2-dehydropantoate 2-reductase n=1 Tax=Cercospora berteroae TaxID=357750 RepID=A0A2S6BX07_9PEZI|nr:hypothetical protein CBER1_09826 [Cercospora berteroae]
MATEADAQHQQNTSGQNEADEKHIDPKVMEQLKAAMSPADKQYAALKDVPRRIHILGTGSIGKLVAHALRGIPDPPPVTLIFHRYQLLQAWEKSKRFITVQDGEFTVPKDGFDVELMPMTRRQHGKTLEEGSQDFYDVSSEAGTKPHEVAKLMEEQQQQGSGETTAFKPVKVSDDDTVAAAAERKPLPGDYAVSDEPIHNLIICTKTIRTLNALSAVKSRISKDSTICFLQNGMGVIDKVNEAIFTDEATRPQYLQGIVSHGSYVPPSKAVEDPFFVVHAGHGTIALGAVPPRPTKTSGRPPTPTGHGTENTGEMDETHVNQLQPTARYITRTLTRTPVLACVAFTPLELLQLQLEKLAVNSVLNPLTALIDNRNGSILYNFAFTRTMRLMLAETSLIIRSLPELRGIPNVPNRFSSERLETLVVSVAHKTRNNISSMLADVRRGAQTEVEFINGYIVKRGEEMGIKAVVNYSMMQVVIGKAMMSQREYEDEVPVAGKGRRANVNRE